MEDLTLGLATTFDQRYQQLLPRPSFHINRSTTSSASMRCNGLVRWILGCDEPQSRQSYCRSLCAGSRSWCCRSIDSFDDPGYGLHSSEKQSYELYLVDSSTLQVSVAAIKTNNQYRA